ncbi:MAG: S-layer homology domain-containing protein [Clostridia bacterium]|nr:S-layer homology domain-containing protein [Clostridia bacterium]
MKKLNRILVTLLITTMIMSSMPVFAAEEVTPTYLAEDGHVLADFSQGTEIIWGDGNLTTTDEVGVWNSVGADGSITENTHTGLLASLDPSKRANKSVVKDGKYLSFESVDYINLWMYVPVQNDTAYSAICFIGKGNKNIYYKIYHNFKGWKLVSLKKADATLYNNQVTAASWNEVQNIWVYANGDWLASSPLGTKVYIGKMWATTDKQGGDVIETDVSISHAKDEENVTADRNEITYTFEEDLLPDNSEKAYLKVERAGMGQSFSEVPASISCEGDTATVTVTGGLKLKSKYKITLEGINTKTGKYFKDEREFTTEGYGGETLVDKTVNMAADFTQTGEIATWKGQNSAFNITDSEAPLNSKYLGSLGKLKTHYDANAAVADETKPAERYLPYYAQKNFASPQDWSDADAVNLLIYSDEAVPGARFEADILTKKDGAGSYFVGLIDGNFEGWRVYTIPISDDWSYYPGKSTDASRDILSYRDKNASWKDVTGLQLVTASFKVEYPAPTELSELYIAHVWTSKKSDEKPVTAISIKNGEFDVPINTTSFELTTAEKLLPISSQIADATLYKHDGTAYQVVSTPTITVSDATVKADFGIASLEKNTKYRLDISRLYLTGGGSVSQRIEFTTASTDVYTSKPSVTEDTDGNLSIEVNAKSEIGTKNIKLVAELYDIDGNYVATATDALSIGTGGGSITATFNDIWSILEGTSDKFKYNVEAYTVNVTDGNKPLLRRIQKTADASVMAYNDAPLSNGNVTVDAQIRDTKVSVSGNCGAAGVRSVTLTIAKEDNSELLLKQIDSAADGSFSAELDISGIITQSGWYKVSANAIYASTSAESTDTFFFADSTMKETIKATINSSVSAQGINTYLQTDNNAAALGISGGDYTHISNVLFEKKPFATFGDITTMIANATDALSELNTKNWIYIAEYIGANKALIIHSNEFDTTYFTLSPETQNEVCADVSELRPFASFNDFRDKLKTVTTPYLSTSGTGDNNNNNNYTDTGGGGGGGGGKKVSDKTLPATPVTPLEPGEVFSDLGAHEWAKADILYLYEKGIVSGVSSNNFKPEANVKREEFVKMLVEALNIPISGNNSGFFDSANGAWYEKYLCAAKESGIVNGRADGSFGVGNTITRQDMAVMMHRALSIMNKLPNAQNEAQSFSDSNDISSYATEAVKLMQGCGLINGMGDNTFAPHKEATRAQAAVIIRRILTAIEKGGVN